MINSVPVGYGGLFKGQRALVCLLKAHLYTCFENVKCAVAVAPSIQDWTDALLKK